MYAVPSLVLLPRPWSRVWFSCSDLIDVLVLLQPLLTPMPGQRCCTEQTSPQFVIINGVGSYKSEIVCKY